LLHEVHSNVVTELDTKAETGHKVDDEDGVLLNRVAAQDDVEHPHAAHKLEEDQEHAESDEGRYLDARQDLDRHEDEHQPEHHVLSQNACDVSVLVVVHVE